MPIGMMRARARSGAMELELCSHTQETGTFWTRTQMKSPNGAGLGKDRVWRQDEMGHLPPNLWISHV